MKVVIDTNVIVSALLSPYAKPALVFNAVIQGKVPVAVDTRILTEYDQVLRRAKFKIDQALVMSVLDFFRYESESVVASPLNIILPDKDDLPFVEVAVAADALAIVTGNKKHFPGSVMSKVGVSVLSPAELIARL